MGGNLIVELSVVKKARRKKYYHDNKERAREYHLTYFEQSTEKYLYTVAKQRALKAGMEFSIDLSDIVIPEKCPYTDLPLTRIYGQGRVRTNPSLDRIDNSKGYVKGNVQVVSDLANRMKVNSSIEELLAFAKGVLKNHS